MVPVEAPSPKLIPTSLNVSPTARKPSGAEPAKASRLYETPTEKSVLVAPVCVQLMSPPRK